ncbi:transposase [Martelella sp. HB161492]|uniref:transposase n=1 Tax=Martelella sp. HB161492 TaxID=2720726 RepID=UPI002484CB94|nr:transposase [Martelella sp. HB161492]
MRRRRPNAHRQWPDEIKAPIMSESLRPGATVNEVAERHGLKANHRSSLKIVARLRAAAQKSATYLPSA